MASVARFLDGRASFSALRDVNSFDGVSNLPSFDAELDKPTV